MTGQPRTDGERTRTDGERKGDPLLRVTRVLLLIVMAFAALATVITLAGIPASWILREEIVRHGVDATDGFLAGASALLAAFAVMTVCAVLFLRKLVAVIDTVALGTPFSRDNARRLRAMGWLALAIQGIALLFAPLAAWIESHFPQAELQVGLDLTGLLTALLLFILARVFDTGAKLAEDAEGTV